jgi:hypothetical protein
MIETHEIRVMDKATDVFDAFPRPAKSFPILNPPDVLKGQVNVLGWETDRRAVGILHLSERMILLLEIWDGADQDSIDGIVSETSASLSRHSEKIERGDVTYWFWHGDEDRAMICAAPDDQGNIMVSRAFGRPAVMDVLRMNPADARADAADAFELLSATPE